jgi:16S rRNA (guanine527-N7)-methyltransferase
VTPQPIEIKEVIEIASARFPELDPEILELYLREVLEWNPRVGLVSKRDTERIVSRLVADSMFLWDQALKMAPENRALGAVDVGTGGGFPGVIWKLLSPTTRVLLVERREKKATFLERLPSVLQIEGLEVFSGASEEALRQKRYRGAFDIGVTMAVSSPESAVSLVDGFVSARGLFVTLGARAIVPPTTLAGGFKRVRLIETDPATCAVYRRS